MAQRNPAAPAVGGALLLSLGLHAAIACALVFLPVTPKIQPSSILEAVLISSPTQLPSKERVPPASATAASAGTEAPASDADAAPSQARRNTAALSPSQEVNRPSEEVKTEARTDREGPLNYLALRDEIAAFGLAAAAREQAEQAAPRIRRLSATAAPSAAEAAYLEMWRQKVERIGNANYPAKAAYGDLRLRLLIRHDGALLDARVVETSGNAELDQAALDILRLAAPFAQFSVDMRKSYDQLEILHRWRFSRSGAQLVR